MTDLQAAYSEIFDNFTESVSEFSNVEAQVLKDSIIEEINACKQL